MTKKLLIALATIAVAAFALAACGGDDEDDSTEGEATTQSSATTGNEEPPGDGGTIPVAAVEDGSLAYTETELTGQAGSNAIEFDNPSSVPHNVYVEDESGTILAETETVTADSTATVADFAPGTYAYYCDIAGHREGGMEGTLTVE